MSTLPPSPFLSDLPAEEEVPQPTITFTTEIQETEEMPYIIKNYKKEPLSVLTALAVSLARDIDRGQHELIHELELVLEAIPNANQDPRWS